MHFILDVGNTRTKWALFNDGDLVDSGRIEPGDSRNEVNALLENHPIRATLVAATGDPSALDLQAIENTTLYHRLTHLSRLPFNNTYETPESLGVDRMGLVAAACLHYPDTPVLVIDAGSCVTYDLVDEKANYLGGAISPGIRMRYRAMNEFTASLPLLEPKRPEGAFGRTTSASMHHGAVGGVIAEIQVAIAHHREAYPNLTVVLTGGDSEFLLDSIKNDIFAHSNFLLEGLNYLLELNTI